MDRPKLLAAAFLAGAFSLGASVGYGWDRTLAGRAPATVASGAPRASMYDAFAEELGLSAEQRAAVDSILDERHRIMDSLVAPVRPQLEAARESARAQIRRRLTAEQQLRFDRYLARLRDREAARGRR